MWKYVVEGDMEERICVGGGKETYGGELPFASLLDRPAAVTII